MDTRIISINLTLSETDVVLNALEEKAISINNLREYIFNNANEQVKMLKESSNVENMNENKHKKKGNK